MANCVCDPMFSLMSRSMSGSEDALDKIYISCSHKGNNNYSTTQWPKILHQCWFSAGQKGISAARGGETGEKVFLP